MSGQPTSVPRSFGLLVAAALTAVGTVLAAARAPRVIGEFRALYQGLGAEVTADTKPILNFPYVWWVFAIAAVSLLVWVGSKSQVSPVEERQMKRALRILIVLTGLAYGVAAYALYLPFFKLGAVV